MIVEAACIGTRADGIELLRALRGLRPEIDTLTMLPMTELGFAHKMALPRTKQDGRAFSLPW